MKRIVTVQDISCLGKCSLTVALPLISAMGVECAILPTAVLSTHTMFSGFTCCDLTSEFRPIASHWKQEGLGFDGIYTGYLGTVEQIDMVKELIDSFGHGGISFIDPAMADNGKLYPAFDEKYAKHMLTLCARADIIVPNITEACYMTDTEYRSEYDEEYAKGLLLKLSESCKGLCVLTGVGFEEGKTGVMAYDSKSNEFWYYCHDKLPVSYHGTGDIFSSVCFGGIVRGLSWKEAIEIAADYTAECIRVTGEDPAKPWYGVNFEQVIPQLVDRIK